MSTPPEQATPLELFRQELEDQVAILNQALLDLEVDPANADGFDRLMRAAHSVKGAARIVGLHDLEALAHAFEDTLVAVRDGRLFLSQALLSRLFTIVDCLETIQGCAPAEMPGWIDSQRPVLEAWARSLMTGSSDDAPVAAPAEALAPSGEPTQGPPAPERVVRVDADQLNRIMALAGESLVEAKWLQPFADSLAQLKDRQNEMVALVEQLHQQGSEPGSRDGRDLLEQVRAKERDCQELLVDRLGELELFARRANNVAYRLYREVIGSNMRPFSDGLAGFPRMVRDISRSLGKQVRLEVIGKGTLVDRDILKRLESPLTHILRNAIDHGVETPEARLAAGKPAEATLRIEALHRGGMLAIHVADDGRGVDLAAVRRKLVQRQLMAAEAVARLSEADLLDALMLPGFSTATAVTELSGRGVGLDVVRAMVQEVGGSVRLSSTAGAGTSIHFQLPLTLSVVRTLLVEIAGEPYAFPLARLDQIVAIDQSSIHGVEGRDTFSFDGRTIGLVAAREVMALPPLEKLPDPVPLVVISDHSNVYGVMVDRFLGEQDLVVRPLDSRLGRVANISAAALMGDGLPILIVDVPDLVRSIDARLMRGDLHSLAAVPPAPCSRRRVLVVDDSATVRQSLVRCLIGAGYRVEQAADGREAWTALQGQEFDLVLTDVEMPLMDGLELVRQLRQQPRLASLPVMIVSSREGEQDRLLGLEAGADYYLDKSSFSDARLLAAVHDLIGPA